MFPIKDIYSTLKIENVLKLLFLINLLFLIYFTVC